MVSGDDGVIALAEYSFWAGGQPHRPYMVGMMQYVANSLIGNK